MMGLTPVLSQREADAARPSALEAVGQTATIATGGDGPAGVKLSRALTCCSDCAPNSALTDAHACHQRK